MGYSGLIYAAIVAAWAAFLVPRWVRRNEEVERAREVDQERGVRVLSRRSGPPQAPHGSVTLPPPSASAVASGTPGYGAPEAGAGPARAASAPIVSDDAFALAARRRRRMLGVLLLLVVGSLALVVLGRAPGWAPLGPGVLLALFLFLARRAAVVQARRRRVAAHRAAVASRRRSTAADAAVVWASPVEAAEEGAQRRLVLPDEIVAEPPATAEGEWSPVSVPLPTYLTKPKANRPAARKIDLGQPGAWTSGRLDPASSIELPHRAPEERPAAASPSTSAEPATPEETIEEHRRAVGD
ncbi:divisome protein SepX/GlpR [Jiangella anatolica]|uniref:Uncharacterized protein n=1 Tax=Jiangella anatolica TaxID=2670374 RepID=A0A2W2CE57_9ACTN|nr:hypothetical protein [Jiangella anatolica]PZF83936.1 hypothetical protein C1I92_10780 [Jiangella anatolica]